MLIKGQLVGIISDRDLKETSLSKVTSLDIWELHYLMSKIEVSSIMTTYSITVTPGTTLEHPAILMFDNKIGGYLWWTERRNWSAYYQNRM